MAKVAKAVNVAEYRSYRRDKVLAFKLQLGTPVGSLHSVCRERMKMISQTILTCAIGLDC